MRLLLDQKSAGSAELDSGHSFELQWNFSGWGRIADFSESAKKREFNRDKGDVTPLETIGVRHNMEPPNSTFLFLNLVGRCNDFAT